jgi:hypothetical protein
MVCGQMGELVEYCVILHEPRHGRPGKEPAKASRGEIQERQVYVSKYSFLLHTGGPRCSDILPVVQSPSSSQRAMKDRTALLIILLAPYNTTRAKNHLNKSILLHMVIKNATEKGGISKLQLHQRSRC